MKMEDSIVDYSYGKIVPQLGMKQRVPYPHQKDAMECLDIMDKRESFSTLLVLPTGGGKTYTASSWLLRNAINKKKKILWIAHRQMLLDQAVDSFQKYAYAELLPNISSFTYRIISGSERHGRMIDIDHSDELLVVSKDSVGKNLERLLPWLQGEDTIYMVVDEAHHSTAKTYRKVIEYVREAVPNLKLLGLTATPFRTSDAEKGLLSKIYTDGVSSRGKRVVKNSGITYQVALKELINAQILSKPVFESCYTDESYGNVLSIDAWEHIQQMDVLPEEIAKEIAQNATRNNLIVGTYQKNIQKYGQTIVFAVNVLHAITLSSLFQKAGISADFIVSSLKDAATGVTISNKENEEKLKNFREGKLQVLINVNILTEGVDLPQTKTVFLARPTVSTILMTQMIGRALRGTAAGGTKEAYIVSFIDQWNEHISWVNPESIFADTEGAFLESKVEREKHDIQLISVAKIEEFAKILDDSVDTTAVEQIPFQKRIPIGMYAFTYLEEQGMDRTCYVMVYDSTQNAYEHLMNSLPELFQSYSFTEEYIPENMLIDMEAQCHDTFFCGEMIPPYEKSDVCHILKYFAQFEIAPQFYTFAEIDKERLDVAQIAKTIYDEDMGPRRQGQYLDDLWNSTDDNLIKLFFSRKLYFLRLVNGELLKLTNPEMELSPGPTVINNTKNPEDMTFSELREYFPDKEKEIRNEVFAKALLPSGEYQCARCKMKSVKRIYFQVDHILAMNNGGKTRLDNLQILCRHCNGVKGDKE